MVIHIEVKIRLYGSVCAPKITKITKKGKMMKRLKKIG